jgi:phytoene dehydrogenase-like protein
LFDTRAPSRQHTAWAYCHVPNGYGGNLADRIEQRIESHAPGFRDLILARASRGPAALEACDANYIGSDINGGLASLGQMFFRPVARFDRYSTPLAGGASQDPNPSSSGSLRLCVLCVPCG